jgi:hypothetical protein
MSKKKQLMFIMPVMKGGGAEKVAALLLNEFNKNGYDCELVLTNSERNEIVDRGLSEDVTVTVLREAFRPNGIFKRLFLVLFRFLTSLMCKIPEAFGKKVPAKWARLSFGAQYYDELKALRKHFKSKPESTVLSFLQPSIPLGI